MNTIAPAALDTLLRAQPDLPLLDVRTPMEYAQVHVPQARNIPLDSLAPRALFDQGVLPQGQPIYILCQTGGRATKAAEKFASEGFAQAVVVEGGTKAWSEAGLPVDWGVAQGISLERQVRIAAGSLVLLGVLLGWFVHPYFIGLSAFVGAGLVFAGISDWCGMGLLLAKAPWNQRPPG
ncbi:MAG: rhodanese-like domain-containing protein [Chthoniobacter sp.]